MARATFVKSARKTIYRKGKSVQYVSPRGKREGETLTKIDKTIPYDENDKPLILEGESYYHWTLFRSPKQYSRTPPKASQLTGSEFLSSIYAILEQIEDFSTEEVYDFNNQRDEIVTELEGMRDECQEKLDNMPESLQEAPSGEILSSRIENLEDMISIIENIEVEEVDEFEFDDTHTEDEDEQREEWQERYQDSINNAIEEMQAVSYDGE